MAMVKLNFKKQSAVTRGESRYYADFVFSSSYFQESPSKTTLKRDKDF